MLHKTLDSFYQSTLLTTFPSLIHGFTSRDLGDMRDEAVRIRTMGSMMKNGQKLLWGTQSHGTDICMVNETDRRHQTPFADGFIYQKKNTHEPPILSVHAADCTPILFYDPIAEIVGCVHAGWRGTLAGIASKMINLMRSQGSEEKDILACIGPHIGGCCYNVPEKRATAFIERFGSDKRWLLRSMERGTWTSVGQIIDNLWQPELLQIILTRRLRAHPARIMIFFHTGRIPKRRTER